jgi:hypothetical protein
MSEREQSFAKLLRFYPKTYRERNGDEILATLLEVRTVLDGLSGGV